MANFKSLGGAQRAALGVGCLGTATLGLLAVLIAWIGWFRDAPDRTNEEAHRACVGYLFDKFMADDVPHETTQYAVDHANDIYTVRGEIVVGDTRRSYVCAVRDLHGPYWPLATLDLSDR